MSGKHLLRILATVAAAAGMLLSLYTLRVTPERLRILERKTRDWADLQALQLRSGIDAEAVALFEKLPEGQPPALADLAREAQLTTPPEVRLRDSLAAPEGWSLRTAEIAWNTVRFTELARFIRAAESARPPWRLRACTLATVERGEDRARATLVMEALEKKRP